MPKTKRPPPVAHATLSADGLQLPGAGAGRLFGLRDRGDLASVLAAGAHRPSKHQGSKRKRRNRK